VDECKPLSAGIVRPDGTNDYNITCWAGPARLNFNFVFCNVPQGFIEPQGTHMVSVNQPPPPFQVDRP